MADQARQALGIVAEPRPLADVPPPIVHTAFGAAVCALAVALRPDVLGLARGFAAGVALAVASGVALAGYDRLVYPPERRPPGDAVALPVAAVISFTTILAGTPEFGVRLGAGIVAALVVGGVPQLLWRQLASGHPVYRLLRDVAGAIVLAPALVAGVSEILPGAPRAVLVAAGVCLVSYDGLRNEPLPWPRAALGALIPAGAVTAAAMLAGPRPASAGQCAALLLILWYGVRGIAAVVVSADRRRGAVSLLEHAAFIGVAAVALRLVLVSP